jgi:hypothetical protein
MRDRGRPIARCAKAAGATTAKDICLSAQFGTHRAFAREAAIINCKTRLLSNASVHLRMTVKAFLGAPDLNDFASAFPVFSSGRQQNKKMV